MAAVRVRVQCEGIFWTEVLVHEADTDAETIQRAVDVARKPADQPRWHLEEEVTAMNGKVIPQNLYAPVASANT